MKNSLLFLSWLTIWMSACKEPYDLPVPSSEQSILVVEGVLNSGAGPTTVRVTRTSKLDKKSVIIPELHAHLTVEGNDNSITQLTESTGGFYGHPQLSLAPDKQYR